MVTNGVAAAAVAAPAGGPSALGLAGSALYGAYGLRLTSFLLRRQSDAAYKPKWDSVQEKSDRMGLGGRLGVVTFVSLTQAAYALPITNAVKSSPAPGSGGGMAATVGWVGVGLAAAGLLLEHLADEQKLAAKRADPSAPVTTGEGRGSWLGQAASVVTRESHTDRGSTQPLQHSRLNASLYRAIS